MTYLHGRSNWPTLSPNEHGNLHVPRAAHLWGGNAIVKISAAWSFVLCYNFAQASKVHFVCTRDAPELRGNALRTTRIVAWLFWWILRFTVRLSCTSHNANAGTPSRLKTSDSVVERDVEVCLAQRNRRQQIDWDAGHPVCHWYNQWGGTASWFQCTGFKMYLKTFLSSALLQHWSLVALSFIELIICQDGLTVPATRPSWEPYKHWEQAHLLLLLRPFVFVRV